MGEQSTSKGFAVLSLATILVKVLSILYVPVLLAIIGEEGNGIYAAAYQVYVFIYVLTNSGLPVAISKLVAELIAVKNYKDAVRSFKIARALLLVLGIFMSLIMALLARPLSRALHFERSYLAILALSPTLLFTSTASAYRGYFQGRGNMVPTAVSQVIEQIVNTVLTLVFAAVFIKYSLEAACAGGTVGTSLGALAAVVVLLMFYSKNKKIKVPNNYRNIEVKRYSYKELLKKILHYSVPITLCVGLQYAGNLVDLWNTKSRLLAAGFSDSVATQLYSYLHKYQQLINAPLSIISALSAAVLPAISGAVAANDRDSVNSKVNYAFRTCLMISLPAAVGLSVLSSPIYQFLKFGGGWYIMLYGSFVLVLMSIVQIQSITMQGAGLLYSVTLNQVLGIVVKILVNYIFIAIPSINILGTIIGSLVGNSVPLVLNTIAIKKRVKININFPKLAFKPFISSVIMGMFVYLTNYLLNSILAFIHSEYIINALSVIVSIFVGMVTYALYMIITGGITARDLDILPKKLTRFIPKRIKGMIR